MSIIAERWFAEYRSFVADSRRRRIGVMAFAEPTPPDDDPGAAESARGADSEVSREAALARSIRRLLTRWRWRDLRSADTRSRTDADPYCGEAN
ncbi:MAG: hypothetical protein ABFS34_06835 [Gemmatimonadota bacterium]